MDQIAETVNELGAVLRRSVDCRRRLASPPDDDSLPDALALLDDLDEHAHRLVTRARLAARRTKAAAAPHLLH